MRALVLALLAAAVPAAAQASADAPPPAVVVTEAAVDSALVGEWTLESVVEPGQLDDYGVDLQAMTCTFSAEGEARVSMMAVQDGETMSRQRTFDFEAEDGTLTEDTGDEVQYRVLEDGQLEIQDGEMIIRLARARP